MKLKQITFLILVISLALGCGTDDSSNNGSNNGNNGSNNGNNGSNNGNGSNNSNNGNNNSNNGTNGSNNGVEDMGTEDMASDQGSDMADMNAADMEADAAMTTGMGGDTCALALDVSAGGTWINQTTSGASDDYSSPIGAANCPSGAASGNDVVFSVNPTVRTQYRIEVNPDSRSFDPFIYVREDCAQEACIDGTVFNGPGAPEALEIDVPANATYFIIIDGELGTEGGFSIEVLVNPPK